MSTKVYTLNQVLINNVSTYSNNGTTTGIDSNIRYPKTYSVSNISVDTSELLPAIIDAYTNCKRVSASVEIKRGSGSKTTILSPVEVWSNSSSFWLLYIKSGKDFILLSVSNGKMNIEHRCNYQPNSNSPLTLTLKSISIID